MIRDLDRALDDTNAFAKTARDGAYNMKSIGSSVMSSSEAMGGFGGYRDQTKSRQNFSAFRNWLYSAINALSMEAAAQPISIAHVIGAADEKDEGKKRSPRGSKNHITKGMPSATRNKVADQEYDVVLDHPLSKSLEQPNPVQNKWQFIYSFVANLNLTGWSYVVFEPKKEGGFVMYSLPTTWVRPDHTKGPYAEFYIKNPRDPAADANSKPLTRENVAFAYLPDPGNPLSAMAPATSQMPAIRIDNHIQASQEQHFEKGIFPSVIVTVGKEPLDGVAGGGTRPRLTGAQRRQVYTAINRAMAGVANYGAPAIVDGLIESITRFSATENEMGWSKSEDKVRTRILSAFCVHPYILGEPVSVGGYAQVAKIEERFCKRVNTYLDMLSTILTEVCSTVSGEKNLLVWLEETAPHDPDLNWRKLQYARTNGDVSQNEIRTELGLGPDEDGNEATISGTQPAQIVQLLGLLAQGAAQPEQVSAMLRGMGLPDDLAKEIAGKAKPPQPPQPPQNQFPPKPKPEEAEKPPKPEEDVDGEEDTDKLQKQLQELVTALKTPIMIDVGDVAQFSTDDV